MAAAADAPALPWAVPVEQAKDELQLQPQDRIEIRWLITFNNYEGGEAHSEDVWRWWAAIVVGPKAPEGQEVEQHKAYEILYEAYEAFAEERTTVRITGPRTLLDERHPDGELLWRRQGDTSVTDEESDEGEEEEEEQEEEEVDENGQPYIKQDKLDDKLAVTLLTACHNATVTSGTSLEELQADTFKQQLLAKACNDMMAGIRSMIEKKEATGDGGMVTSEDVQEMFQNLKRQRTG